MMLPFSRAICTVDQFCFFLIVFCNQGLSVVFVWHLCIVFKNGPSQSITQDFIPFHLTSWKKLLVNHIWIGGRSMNGERERTVVWEVWKMTWEGQSWAKERGETMIVIDRMIQLIKWKKKRNRDNEEMERAYRRTVDQLRQVYQHNTRLNRLMPRWQNSFLRQTDNRRTSWLVLHTVV